MVNLVRLELRKDIAQMVAALLVKGLKCLKDEGRLRLPLLGGRFELGGSGVHLHCVGLAALLGELISPVLRFLELPRHGGQVRRDGVHVLHLLAVLEVAQGVLDILLDTLSEQMVRGGDGIGGLQDLVPWCLKDAAARLQLAFGQRGRRRFGGRHTQARIAHWAPCTAAASSAQLRIAPRLFGVPR